MPGPTPTPVHSDATLPTRVDCVVIGGGIIGVSAALELAERGYSVALCEKGEIAGEQSSRNWGWVRIARRDPREVPLMAEALRIWKGLDARIGRATGYTRTGLMYMCADQTMAAKYDRWRRHLEGTQLPARMLGLAEIAAMQPGASLKGVAALYTPEDGRAEPQLAAPAIAEAARDRGANIFTSCAVRGVERSAGRISAVVTERGPIACSNVIVAGGAWSGLFLRSLGVSLPQLHVISHVLRTSPVPEGPDTPVWCQGFAIRRRSDGGHTIANGSGNTVDIVPDSFRYGLRYLSALREQRRDLQFRFGRAFWDALSQPARWSLDRETVFERRRILDPEPSEKILGGLLEEVRRAFPAMAAAHVVQKWAGMIDVMPDAIPVISGVDAVPGLFVATGFSGHGFGIGPAAGRLAADLVTGATPCVDPAPFRLARFSDGSRIAPNQGF